MPNHYQIQLEKVNSFLSDIQLTKENKNKVEAFLQTFIFRSPEDIKRYLEIAKKYDLSINSKQIISAFPNFLRTNLRNFSDLMHGFSSCGFYKEHLGELGNSIVERSFQFIQKPTRDNINSAISLLVHIKNLGILENIGKKNEEILRNFLGYAAQIFETLDDVQYRSLLEIALYAKDVLKISLPQNLIEISKLRKLPKTNESSEIQRDIFAKVIDFLTGESGDGWTHIAKTLKKGEQYQIGANLIAVIEGDWGKISEYQEGIKNADILLIFTDPKNPARKEYFSIEIDGDKFHTTKIDGNKIVDGKTRARQVLAQGSLGARRSVVIDEDKFRHFLNKQSARNYLSTITELSDFRTACNQAMTSFASETEETQKNLQPEKTQAAEVAVAQSAAVAADQPVKKESKESEKNQSPKKSALNDDEVLRDFLAIRAKEDEDLNNPLIYVKSLNARQEQDFDVLELKRLLSAAKNRDALIMNCLKEIAASENPNAGLFLFFISHLNAIYPGHKSDAIRDIRKIKSEDANINIILERFRFPMNRSYDESFKFNTSFATQNQQASWHDTDNTRLAGLIQSLQTNFHDTLNPQIQELIINNLTLLEVEFILLDYTTANDICTYARFYIEQAMKVGNFGLARLLIDKGYMNSPDKKGKNSNPGFLQGMLAKCIVFKDVEMLRYLVSQGFDMRKIVFTEEDKKNPLFHVAIRKDFEMFKYLHEELGYKLDFTMKFGESTPTRSTFQILTLIGDLKILRYYIEQTKMTPDEMIKQRPFDFIANNIEEVAGFFSEELGINFNPEDKNQFFNREFMKEKITSANLFCYFLRTDAASLVSFLMKINEETGKPNYFKVFSCAQNEEISKELLAINEIKEDLRERNNSPEFFLEACSLGNKYLVEYLLEQKIQELIAAEPAQANSQASQTEQENKIKREILSRRDEENNVAIHVVIKSASLDLVQYMFDLSQSAGDQSFFEISDSAKVGITKYKSFQMLAKIPANTDEEKTAKKEVATFVMQKLNEKEKAAAIPSNTPLRDDKEEDLRSGKLAIGSEKFRT